MARKSTPNVDATVLKVLKDTQKTLETLQELPVMTGGFSTLMTKIDSMQESQKKLASDVEEIHKAIYDPDEGIYARIKNSASSEKVEEVEKTVTSLSEWKSTAEKNAAAAYATDKVVMTQQQDIESLKNFKNVTYDILKKVGIGAIGALVMLICKVLYAVITGHVQFVN